MNDSDGHGPRDTMTAIFYPDCRATASNGTFVLEARSPHNGTINHRDGRPAAEDEFGFKYREHQRDFRYRLLAVPSDPSEAGGRGGVVWERWQDKGEDSPHELVVADDGWSANLLDAGDVVVCPAYGRAEDDVVARLLETVFAGRRVVPVRANDLAGAGGVVNCVTWTPEPV